MPLNRVTNLINGNVVDAPELNSEFNNIVNALNTTNSVDLGIRFSSPTVPPLILNQEGAGPILRLRQAGADKVIIQNQGQIETVSNFKSTIATGTRPIDVVSTTVCNNLNADLLDGLHAAAFLQGATAKSAGSISFFEENPSITSISSEDRPVAFIPANQGTAFITGLRIVFLAGMHTPGSVLTYTIRYRNAAAGVIDIGSISLNDTNNTTRITYAVPLNFNFPPNDGGYFTFYLATRTGTITERSVSIGLVGTQPLIP